MRRQMRRQSRDVVTSASFSANSFSLSDNLPPSSTSTEPRFNLQPVHHIVVDYKLYTSIEYRAACRKVSIGQLEDPLEWAVTGLYNAK